MKLRIFTVLCVLCFNIPAWSCPELPIGYIRVVDQHNNIIKNAKIWQYYTSTDSSLLRKTRWYPDTNLFRVYENYYDYYIDFREYKIQLSEKQFRIQAEGYTDVLLSAVKFIDVRHFYDTFEPILTVVLYGKKYIKANNSISVIHHYFLKDTVNVTDTSQTILNGYFTNYSSMEGQSCTKISTYPNPVSKELHIRVNYNFSEPVMASLSDAQGREMTAILVESETAVMNLESYKPGNYYIVIKDARGEYLHRQLIIKL